MRRCLMLLLVMILGCGGTGGPGTSPTPSSTPSNAEALPLLGPGTHISVIRGFNLPDAALDPVLDQYWREAVEAGMRSARVQIDWADIEPEPGVFDMNDLIEQVEAFEAQGLQVLVGAYAIDSEGPVMPPDLQEKVLEGTRVDDPEVLTRHAAFVAHVTEALKGHDVWGLLITNEPGPWFDDSSRTRQEYVAFYQNAVRAAHDVRPEFAIGATHTKNEALRTPEKFHAAVVQALDFASYNYYAGKNDFTGSTDQTLNGISPAEVRAVFDAFAAASDGKFLIIQEFGAPAGYVGERDSALGASPELQREFYENGLLAASEHPKVRAVYGFQLVDWSEALTQFYRDALEGEAPASFIDEFIEALETLGLIDLEGQARPAWQAFLTSVRQNR